MNDSDRKRAYLDVCRILIRQAIDLKPWLDQSSEARNGRDDLSAEAKSFQSARGDGGPYVFTWEGTTWFARFRNEEGRIRDLFGARYFAVLLRSPRVHHWLADLTRLSGVLKDPIHTPRPGERSDDTPTATGFSFQAKSDHRAIEQARQRLNDLQQMSGGSPYDEVARSDEIEQLGKYLTFAVSGRQKMKTFRHRLRGAPSPDAVGNAMISCIKEMSRCGLVDMARHIRMSISPYAEPIGYLPDDKQISWHVVGPRIS